MDQKLLSMLGFTEHNDTERGVCFKKDNIKIFVDHLGISWHATYDDNVVEKSNWPDEIRLKMIEKSEFYQPNEKIYQYGYYDGYQQAQEESKRLREELEAVRNYLTNQK